MSEHLIPISYHLREFNQYIELNLPAATNGNITLTGENTVGKTTLANCFFPMLIDGSIDTPSFNAAKDMKQLSRGSETRNSQQQSRTFESMLLGWGSGAMKARTGYSYLHLRSAKRQVILGIGARRAVNDPARRTWWFVAIAPITAAPLAVVTTQQGHTLDQAGFESANADLITAKTLQVFPSAKAYREAVASQVYGFSSGRVLGRLANTYRLLASPILSAGNATFEPIRTAMKLAQEGIDPQVIAAVADSLRAVNQGSALLDRVKTGLTRLDAMQANVWWRNWNHLDEIAINAYGELKNSVVKKQQRLRSLHQQIAAVNKELTAQQARLDELTKKQAALEEAIRKQATIEERRAHLQEQITQWQAAVAQQQKILNMIQQLKQRSAKVANKQTELAAQQNQLREQTLAPAQTALNATAAHRSELQSALAETTLAKLAASLTRYQQQVKAGLAEAQRLSALLQQLGQNVALVTAMKTDLAAAIDTRIQSPLAGRAKANLQADNQAIHDRGAAAMNADYPQLIAAQNTLVQKHPDISAWLANPQQWQQAQQTIQTLQQAITALDQLAQEAKLLADRSQQFQAELARTKETLRPDFDLAAVQAQITAAQAQVDALHIDATLTTRLATVQQQVVQFRANIAQLDAKHAALEKTQSATEALLTEEQAQLTAKETTITAAVQVLAPYAPDHAPSIDSPKAALAYSRAEQAHIRRSPYMELTDKLSKLIRRNDAQGNDVNALDDLFESRGHTAIASAMRSRRSKADAQMTILPFDVAQAHLLLVADRQALEKSLAQQTAGSDLAIGQYMSAVIERINAQFELVDAYNQLLTEATTGAQPIRLKIKLVPVTVSQTLVDETLDATQDDRPLLHAEIAKRLQELVGDLDAVSDSDFQKAAQTLLDTRGWTAFQVWIKRRQAQDYEEVDNKFVSSGGSGAEKAQAMVLPLLLVPKMTLLQAKHADAPYLVMFDEFADKLDPETAKSFARTISNFGFNFIATMPTGAQNKVLADGVANRVYELSAPANANDGRFHENQVTPAVVWQKAVPND